MTSRWTLWVFFLLEDGSDFPHYLYGDFGLYSGIETMWCRDSGFCYILSKSADVFVLEAVHLVRVRLQSPYCLQWAAS